MRRIRYQEIADDLRLRARAASPGSLLSSESELSAEFSASRVTVRRALELVRDDGLISARQGFGWIVSTEPIRQSLERLGTIESHVETSGRDAARKVIEFSFESPPPHVRELLGSGKVLRVQRLNLADGEPFARVTVWCPEALGAELSRAEVERSPFYELLPVALGGTTQTIGAAAAEPDDAEVLAIPAGSPVLRCRRVTTSEAGEVVLFSEHVFPAHRTEFVVDLPRSEPSLAPSGLRLVD